MKLILFGCKAVGKTTIGKALAESLQLPHMDSDAHLEKSYGPISQLYSQLGEEAFREKELYTLQEISTHPPCVLSLGGGAAMQPGIKQLFPHDRWILLTASPQLLWKRIKSRPYLGKEWDESSLINQINERNARYRLLADHEIDVTDRSPEEIVSSLLLDFKRI